MTKYDQLMESMLVSEFKAKAISVLRRVKKTGEPVLVTLRGQPLAEVVPVRENRRGGVRLGAGRGLIKKRPGNRALVSGGFSAEWEMNG